MATFIFGGDTGETPETLAQKRRVAIALMQQDGTPRNVGEGLAAVGRALSGRFAMNYLADQEKAGRETAAKDFAPIASMFGGGGTAATTPSGSSASAIPLPGAAAEIASTGPQAYRDAIASIESEGSGDYAAIGPTHPKMGRALGRYQVMEANIGPWSKEALGREVSPDEFLADPKLQDAIFDHKFNGYVQQYGPEGAAQAWFAGPGGVGKADRKDSLGTSVGAYSEKFTNALGGNQQVAQALTQPQPAPSVDTGAILKALSNPWLPEGQRAVAEALLQQENARRQAAAEQQLKQSDPKYRMELQKGQIELENLRNPKIAPADQARIAADRERLGLDREKFTADQADNALTTDIKEYNFYADREKAAGRQPLGPLEWDMARRKSSAQNTTVNVGEGDKFYENLDKKNAETFAALSDAGMQARARLGQIDRLEGLFANVPQGLEGGFKKLAGDWGVAIGEGTSDIQAASALLEKMVPEQRAPGSGPMSDADIRMFRASLPRVLNQPGGNELIFQTMRGIAEYEQQMGAIADAVADREIKPAEARQRIRELKNPLENYKIPDGPTPNEGTKKTRTGVNWSYDK